MHLICYLSVFYFLKIINFSYIFYLWLKWRINKVAFTLPLVSAFSVYELSFAVQFWCLLVSCPKKYERHMTGLLDVSNNKTVNDIIIFITGSLSSFSISLIFFFLLLLSSWRHMKHIRFNVRASRDPSIQAHFRAKKTVFLLCPVALQKFALFLTCTGEFFATEQTGCDIWFMIGNQYPLGHSYVVIFGYSQTKKAFLGFSGTCQEGKQTSDCINLSLYYRMWEREQTDKEEGRGGEGRREGEVRQTDFLNYTKQVNS